MGDGDDLGRGGPAVAAALLAVLALIAAVAVGHGSFGSTDALADGAPAHDMAGHRSMPLDDPPVWADGTVATPTRHTGPQGGTGQFVAKCTYSHSGEVDPIVYPGEVGVSHRHDFYGSTNVDENSTPDSMRAGGTTCDKPGDDAAYWQPTLYDGDTVVEPLLIHAYYRAAPGIDPRAVKRFPDGLMMLAGDPFATEAPSTESAGWTCGVRTDLLSEPPNCPVTAPLAMVLTFPDCWDGQNADVPGHRRHMTYSRDGACPEDHPVSVPQLTVSIKYPISGPGHDLRLASGSVHTAHGDFFNGWVPAALEREIRSCIRRGVVCDLASNRSEEDLFQAS